MKLYIYWNN